MQLVVLIVGPGKDHEVAPFTAVLPALELLESIAPMTLGHRANAPGPTWLESAVLAR